MEMETGTEPKTNLPPPEIDAQGVSLNDLAAQIYQAEKDAGSYDRFPHLFLFAVEGAIEGILRAAALREAQGVPPRFVYSSKGSIPSGIPYDIAQCMYILLRYCGQEGIDIERHLADWRLYGANRQ